MTGRKSRKKSGRAAGLIQLTGSVQEILSEFVQRDILMGLTDKLKLQQG